MSGQILTKIEGFTLSNRGRVRIRLNSSHIDFVAVPDPNNPSNGGVGRNSFRAAGVASLDTALTKSFKLKEKVLDIRLEVFNAFNRSHFAVPVRILESPGFGSSVSTALPARTVQLAVRYLF
ncbi:MAG: hypothetical protein JNN15_19720 [Blastocatellia bacterium]|nr:hypothetical protein [Blastocatellia bacterium]